MITCQLNQPNKVSYQTSSVLLIILMCHTPIVIRCHPFTLWPFLPTWRQNTPQTTDVILSNWCLLEQVLAQWWHPVASSEALDLLYQVMRVVLYCRIGMAIKTTRIVWVIVNCVNYCLFACCPGGCWGDTEQVVTQCWHPVASGVALSIPHQAMPSVLLRRTFVAIKTASGWGAFVLHHCLFCLLLS